MTPFPIRVFTVSGHCASNSGNAIAVDVSPPLENTGGVGIGIKANAQSTVVMGEFSLPLHLACRIAAPITSGRLMKGAERNLRADASAMKRAPRCAVRASTGIRMAAGDPERIERSIVQGGYSTKVPTRKTDPRPIIGNQGPDSPALGVDLELSRSLDMSSRSCSRAYRDEKGGNRTRPTSEHPHISVGRRPLREPRCKRCCSLRSGKSRSMVRASRRGMLGLRENT